MLCKVVYCTDSIALLNNISENISDMQIILRSKIHCSKYININIEFIYFIQAVVAICSWYSCRTNFLLLATTNIICVTPQKHHCFLIFDGIQTLSVYFRSNLYA